MGNTPNAPSSLPNANLWSLSAEDYSIAGSSPTFFLKTPFLTAQDVATTVQTDLNIAKTTEFPAKFTEYLGVISKGSNLCPITWSFVSLRDSWTDIRKSYSKDFRYTFKQNSTSTLAVGDYSVLLFRSGAGSDIGNLITSFYPSNKVCGSVTLNAVALYDFSVSITLKIGLRCRCSDCRWQRIFAFL
jgi:hypothetical protein